MNYTSYEMSRVWRERRRVTSKLCSTIKIMLCLGMARTFGEYRHNIWNGQFDYAVYRWRGKEWPVPTTTISDNL